MNALEEKTNYYQTACANLSNIELTEQVVFFILQ